ncbi:hypothetical protein D3C80_1233810 [compost metagenome]
MLVRLVDYHVVMFDAASSDVQSGGVKRHGYAADLEGDGIGGLHIDVATGFDDHPITELVGDADITLAETSHAL